MYRSELKTALQAAKKAAEAVLKVYHSADMAVEIKSDNTPVTAADIASHRILQDHLLSVFTDYGLISEEAVDDQTRDQDHVWVIDPLDGTKEFVERNGQFAISIALVKDKRPVLGLIHLPIADKTYFAIKGQGAFLRQAGHTQPIRVSQKTDRLTLVRSRTRKSDGVSRLMEHPRITTILKVGSATIKGCLVAEGAADIYYSFETTGEWDTCAIDLIVHEAGGVLTDLTGKQMLYNRDDHTNHGFIVLNNHQNFLL